MKATLHFDLDEPYDRSAHKTALAGERYQMFVWDFWNEVIHQMYNNGIPEDIKDPNALLERIRDKFLEHLHNNDLKIDMD